jgi:hypothetical protein
VKKALRKLLGAALLLCIAPAIPLVAGDSASKPNDLQQQVIGKEREELDCLKSGDTVRFTELIADDAVFLNSRGPGTKADVVEHAGDARLLEYTMEDIHFVPLSSTSGLIVYRLTQKLDIHGKKINAQVFASAVWAERDGKWVTLFSQETPAR